MLTSFHRSSVFSFTLISACIIFLRITRANGPAENQVKFLLYFDSSIDHVATFKYESFVNISRDLRFGQNKKTVLFMHGWIETISSHSIKKITKSYLKRNDSNFIVCDWSKLVRTDYDQAVWNMKKLAGAMAKSFLEAFDNGLNMNDFHVVGFSLGAQLAGNVGYYIQLFSNNSKMLRRITGLDPAGPNFDGNDSIHRLSKDDAYFVDIIHTDAAYLGSKETSGHANFWPNGGVPVQPGCGGGIFTRQITLANISISDACSHARSYIYWAESLNEKPSTFIAVSAASYEMYKQNKFDELNTANMGYYCLPEARGNFYLQTNGYAPHGRHEKGTIYSNESITDCGILCSIVNVMEMVIYTIH